MASGGERKVRQRGKLRTAGSSVLRRNPVVGCRLPRHLEVIEAAGNEIVKMKGRERIKDVAGAKDDFLRKRM